MAMITVDGKPLEDYLSRQKAQEIIRQVSAETSTTKRIIYRKPIVRMQYNEGHGKVRRFTMEELTALEFERKLPREQLRLYMQFSTHVKKKVQACFQVVEKLSKLDGNQTAPFEAKTAHALLCEEDKKQGHSASDYRRYMLMLRRVGILELVQHEPTTYRIAISVEQEIIRILINSAEDLYGYECERTAPSSSDKPANVTTSSASPKIEPVFLELAIELSEKYRAVKDIFPSVTAEEVLKLYLRECEMREVQS